MAVEDAITVAMCLEKAVGDVPLALQVFERIRFNRSHTVHQASISTRDIYHKNDWSLEAVGKNPDSLVMPLMDWVVNFDVVEAVESNFERLAGEVRRGIEGSIEELSLAAGGTYGSMIPSVNDAAPAKL
jgi:2-polyprenyl-6-methoxyphenol hydroxylase-like FAD-dependent oxidoreductase